MSHTVNPARVFHNDVCQSKGMDAFLCVDDLAAFVDLSECGPDDRPLSRLGTLPSPMSDATIADELFGDKNDVASRSISTAQLVRDITLARVGLGPFRKGESYLLYLQGIDGEPVAAKFGRSDHDGIWLLEPYRWGKGFGGSGVWPEGWVLYISSL